MAYVNFTSSSRGYWESVAQKFTTRYDSAYQLISNIDISRVDPVSLTNQYVSGKLYDDYGSYAGQIEMWGSGFQTAASFGYLDVTRIKLSLETGVDANLNISLRVDRYGEFTGSINAGTYIKTPIYTETQSSGTIYFSSNGSLTAFGLKNEIKLSDGATLTSTTNSNGNYISHVLSNSGQTISLSGDWAYSNSALSINNLLNGEDIIYGTTSADFIFDSLGDDNFIGGAGTDTVIFSGTISQYKISKKDDGGIVVYNTNYDLLMSVERLEFSDVSLAFDTDAANNAGGIYRLYKAALNRTPDLVGLGYWIAHADAGSKDAVQMATDFTYADEFKTLYGVRTADNYMTGEDITALVTKIYENVLDRAPDAGGRDYYVGQITAKSKTVGQVLAEISDSAENKLAVVELIATGIEYTPWVD
jgi:hypothetical protein